MREELFRELVQSIREGGAILRGEKEASRSFKNIEPNVAALREQYGLSQTEFANVFGFSVKTLRNWEQGRRKPQGSARILLQVISKNPKVVFDIIQEV